MTTPSKLAERSGGFHADPVMQTTIIMVQSTSRFPVSILHGIVILTVACVTGTVGMI